MSKNLAPVALFVYKRPEHTARTLEALANNRLAEDTELFVFAEAAANEYETKAVKQVAELFKVPLGFAKTTFLAKNSHAGLAASIIGAVTQLLNNYDSLIIMEDDLVTAPGFLTYMNDGLELYKDEPQVASIHGYSPVYASELPETYFLRGADCWGWGTWRRAWNKFEPDANKLLQKFTASEKHIFDFEETYPYIEMLKKQAAGKLDSWAIRWYASAFLNNMYTLYPKQTLVENIGIDGSGTHCGSMVRSVPLNRHYKGITPVKVEQCYMAYKLMADYFHDTMPPNDFISRLKRFLLSWL